MSAILRALALLRTYLWAALFSAALLPLEAAEPGQQIDFNSHIRPLLSDRCWKCHGPDENTRKAKLRLDTPDGAISTKGETHIIKPGDPAASELFRRITAADPEEQMPPPDSNLSLSPAEVDLIRRWIEQGAQWEKHWAFTPPQKAAPPTPRDSSRVLNDIDRFIFARLEKEELTPAPEASREQLIRRLTFDLTGLPPTLQEIDAFLNDTSAEAYEKVVDRLLASPAYGERMTTDWLDLARYSDTHGYQADRYRPMWPWRDWVISAFNHNMPYDQFITWQLAGDLLPNPTREQILATAFNRHHMQTEEGGSVEEEFRVSYVVDRVNTMGTAFMALTLDCSRCHDHKFDPISQKEFYQLYSFFNNIDESGQTSHFTDSMPVPTLLLSTPEQDSQLTELKRAIAEKEAQFPALRENALPAFEEWLAQRPTEPTLPDLIASFSFEEISENKSSNAANRERPAHAVESPELVEGGPSGKAVSLHGENGFTLNALGEFSRADPFTAALWIKAPAHAPRAVIFHRSMAALDAGSRGYEMLLENGRVTLGLHHMWPGNALKVISKTTLPTNEWVHLTMCYDGSSRADGLRLYLDGQPAELEVIRDNLWKDITYERGSPQLTLGYRFRDNGFRGGAIDEFRLYNRTLTPIEVAHLAGRDELAQALKSPELSAPTRAHLFDYYLAHHHPLHERHLRDLHQLRTEQARLINPIPEVMVMHEMDQPRPAFVLQRGAYDAHGDPVTPGTPEAILPFPDKFPRNRLGLAQWLLAPEHPLTARVAVNRLWQMMFGAGLVATSDNFGSQGDRPTHPELLDWLALDFREHGWDIKRFLKQIALSATYRQSSEPSAEALARDPENKLLARAPAWRLSAEMLRDQALAASGLLVDQRGGPPVKPYQPEGLWEEKSGARYERDRGPALYRRSLYTFWKRTSPPPAMIGFDAAERNVCIVRRQVTSTPLQSLVLLNDPQLVEASRFLAERMLKEGGATLDHQLAFLFRLLTTRAPSPEELTILRQMFAEQRALFASNPQEPLKLLTVGEKSSDPSLPPADLAAASVVASALLNFDAAIIRR